MSIEEQTKKKKNVTRRQKKNLCELTTCHITNPPALKYSLQKHDKRGNDFYTWVNENWVSDVKIPPYETHYGVSNEVEDCIMNTSWRIVNDCIQGTLKGAGPEAIHTLHDSFEKKNGMDFLKSLLQEPIHTKQDIVRHLARLTLFRIPSILQLQYSSYYDTKRHKLLSIIPDFPSLETGFFSNPSIFDAYEELLAGYGKKLGIPGLENVAKIERSLSKKFSVHLNFESPICIGNGHTLAKKFGKIPWDVYFNELGIEDWRKTKFEYNYPAFLRALGVGLDEIPLKKWKLYIHKLYIIGLADYLPEELGDIYLKFKRCMGGQKELLPKKNLFVKFIYDYLPDTFSPLFWDSCGDDSLVENATILCKDLRAAARQCLKDTEWLQPATRVAAIEKVNEMRFLIGKPDRWYVDTLPRLSNIFLENVLILGIYSTQKMIQLIRENRNFWDQGIYRVNAYYYEPFNQITIPYGIITNPFYRKEGGRAWNYGSFGFTVGHEMCHGFDDEGKEFDAFGRKKSWWSRADNRAYNKKVEGIVTLYEKQNIMGKRLDGYNTLGENIADIGGLGIALEALKRDIKKRGSNNEKEELQEFFISYAVGWRNTYRANKLKSNIQTDVHSPAYLRVNLVVSQFDEWYSAFDIQKGSKLYIEEEDRIRFF